MYTDYLHLLAIEVISHDGEKLPTMSVVCQLDEGESKTEKIMEKKEEEAQNQLSWLTTHEGWKQQKKQRPGQSGRLQFQPNKKQTYGFMEPIW